MSSLPIVIGSTALKYHGIGQETPRDIDLITLPAQAAELSWLAQEKKTLNLKEPAYALLKFPTQTVDLALNTANPFNQLLWEKMATHVSKEGLIEIMLDPDQKPPLTIQARVPPLIWLYVMIRGHLHRIPKIGAQSQNIQIWQKWMFHYQAIRQQVGYQLLDRLVKEDPDLRELFATQFQHVTQRLGDAPSMDKAEEEFFQDGVKRYLPHDQLHEEVAQLHRGTKELLFRKFQSNSSSVEMEKDLFLDASRADQLNTIREELMVLFLERKLLPAVVKHGDRLADLKERIQDFREIVCHFCCNLCGSGHHWLRQWCLDHYHLVANWSTYPIQKIQQYVLTFTAEGRVLEVGLDSDDHRLQTWLQFKEYVHKTQEHPENLISKVASDFYNELSESNILELEEEPPLSAGDSINPQLKISLINVNLPKFRCQYRQEYSWGLEKLLPNWLQEIVNNSQQMHTLTKTTFKYYLLTDWQQELREFLIPDSNLETTPYLCFYENNNGLTIYSPSRGTGLYLSAESYLFMIEMREDEDEQIIHFGVHKYSLQDDAQNKHAQEKYKVDTREVSYYHSTCSSGYESEREFEYLNHYGRGFSELNELTEYLARLALNFMEDEEDTRGDYY